MEKILIAGYFNDLFTISYTYDTYLNNTGQIIKMVTLLDFVLYHIKSLFVPSQKIEYSCFHLDLTRTTICLTESKRKIFV